MPPRPSRSRRPSSSCSICRSSSRDATTIRRSTFARKTKIDSDGRVGFRFSRDRFACDIDIPGLPIDQIRYLGKPQNIWQFPRLYINGSSFVWMYVVSLARAELSGMMPEAES